MKKRLLSAFLALAMVLTLIPATVVPAFAATELDSGNPDTVTRPNSTLTGGMFAGYTTNGTYSSVTVTYQATNDSTTGREIGKWYWADTVNKPGTTIYYAVTGGIVSGASTSGTWYPDLAAMTRTDASGTSLTTTSFTLLDNADLTSVLNDSNTRAPTSLTIDVNGYGLTLPGTLPARFSNLTINNRLNPLSNKGTVSAIVKRVPAYTAGATNNLTLNISNTTVASIEIVGCTGNVTLTNVAVTGGITMNGQSTTSNNADIFYNQTLTIDRNNASTVSTSAAIGGPIAISNAPTANVSLTNVIGSPALSVQANGGTITVDGASALGNVTVGTRAGDSTPPTLTINSGTVGAITRVDGDGNSTRANKVDIKSAGKAASLEMPNGTVTVDRGEVTGALTVKSGSLTLNGPVNIGGAVTLPGDGKTTLSISGTGSQINGITATNGGNLTISAWPTGRNNNFGTLNLGTSYGGRGVKGGTFANDFADTTNSKHLWFDTSLLYVLKTTSGKYALYGKDELATAISDIGSDVAGATAEMHILCQASTNTLHLINGGLTWAKIGYALPTGMILPTMVNGYSISTWTSDENIASVAAGREVVIPKPASGNEFKMYANGVATTVVKSITAVAVSPSTPVENQNVRVTLNGTNIQISGAVVPPAAGNIATIELDLQTDALVTNAPDDTAGGSSGTGYLTLTGVQVFYNVDTKVVQFSDLQKLPGGAIVNEKGELVLNNGTGTHYTVSASLAQPASSLDIYTRGNEIQATVSNSVTNVQTKKAEIIDQIAGTDAKFEINGNRAILEAINAAQATITSNSTVSGWVTTAQNYVWRNGNGYKNATTGQPNGLGKGLDDIDPHTGNMSTTGYFGTDATEIAKRYSNAFIVPYLVVNVTGMSQTGTMNATLSVYYRVDVSAPGYDPDEYYTVQTGRALSELTGDMATNPVKVTFATAFPYASATYMHQDGKYVYVQDANKAWSITHAGSGSGSLGTIVLNATPATIELTSNITGRSPALPTGGKAYYDDLQAAIDDTVPGIVTSTNSTSTETMDTVTILGTYAPTQCTVSMTGVARKVKVVSNGNRTISKGNNNTDVQTLNGTEFILQLTRDTAAAGQNIIVANATGGTASVSTKNAAVGQTVTVTLTPAAGYVSNGVSVRNTNGTVVNVNGSGNVYTFVMPAGSVTVTPSFTTGTSAPVNTTVTVSGTNMGGATTTAMSGTVTGGSVVGVTTYPNAGYRTMGVNISTNNGSATATRTGTNNFNFTVPVNATSVTVTPVYDVDNGTLFEDVWSNTYYSAAVSWAVSKGIIGGQSTYSFGSNYNCKRADMVVMLWRAAGSPIVSNVRNPFVDVYASDYYYNAVMWAYSKGITGGVDATHFGPSQSVSRAQTVTFLYRYAGEPAVGTNSGFYDVPSNQYYAKAVTWAKNLGIAGGKTLTSFAPSDNCLRAEIATFLYRDFTGTRA